VTGTANALGAALVAGTISSPLTLGAMRAARRTGFLDRPSGYKAHGAPTPCLGGAAVMASAVLAATALGGLGGDLTLIVALAAGLWAVGTLDDRVALSPKWRVAASILAGVALWRLELGWGVFDLAALDLTLTVLWVVGLVNAFNLMDNLDGATGTVAAVSAAGIGALALVDGNAGTAILALSLAGACLGFLPFNLARPAKIFLGDGGSMPIGFIVAALALQAAGAHALSLLAGAMLVGLVILDTTLVVVSRRRRGVALVTAGRDHLSHRILAQAGTPRRVAIVLGLVQASLCASAVLAVHAGAVPTAVLAIGWVLAGLAAIVVLESRQFLPEAPHSSPTIVVQAPRVAGLRVATYHLSPEPSPIPALDAVSTEPR
jgi:UDP-GlcNAc:undecaprenyl-phosphate GlcNAc-1-phosphate transferase